MKYILEKIIQYKKEELATLKRSASLKDVQHKAVDSEPATDFLGHFQSHSINIIGEIKKASPSAGVIRENFNPLDIARIYEDSGAVALSVLTDGHFFQGSLGNLTQVKKIVSIPCLRKDFTLDPYHIYEARGAGADAILLIVAALDDVQLRDFQDLSQELGMMVLIEVHEEEELNRAFKIKPRLIGVNNRNLKTFETKLETSLTLIKKISGNVCRISESGIESHDDLMKLRGVGFDGFLIGEALMKERDIGKKLRELLGDTRY